MTEGDQKAGTQERNDENKAKRLTKSETVMGRMASSSHSSPQLIDLLIRLMRVQTKSSAKSSA
jgi:hypothetical protein